MPNAINFTTSTPGIGGEGLNVVRCLILLQGLTNVVLGVEPDGTPSVILHHKADEQNITKEKEIKGEYVANDETQHQLDKTQKQSDATLKTPPKLINQVENPILTQITDDNLSMASTSTEVDDDEFDSSTPSFKQMLNLQNKYKHDCVFAMKNDKEAMEDVELDTVSVASSLNIFDKGNETTMKQIFELYGSPDNSQKKKVQHNNPSGGFEIDSMSTLTIQTKRQKTNPREDPKKMTNNGLVMED